MAGDGILNHSYAKMLMTWGWCQWESGEAHHARLPCHAENLKILIFIMDIQHASSQGSDLLKKKTRAYSHIWVWINTY
jgi:hypothetical protein